MKKPKSPINRVGAGKERPVKATSRPLLLTTRQRAVLQRLADSPNGMLTPAQMAGCRTGGAWVYLGDETPPSLSPKSLMGLGLITVKQVSVYTYYAITPLGRKVLAGYNGRGNI